MSDSRPPAPRWDVPSCCCLSWPRRKPGPGWGADARQLAGSASGRSHREFLIAIPAATLAGAGVPVPPDPSLSNEPAQAQLAVERMKQALAVIGLLTGSA
jgi:hypothetical protein